MRDATLLYRYRIDSKEIFSQERAYGEGEVVLYSKLRLRGLKRRSRPRVAVS